MPNQNRLVVNLQNKAVVALDEIMAENESSKTDAVNWALKYANEVRKLVGEGSLIIEKDGKLERYKIM